MLILTIETCTDMATLGLLRDGVVIGEMAFPSRHTLVSHLLSRLDWLLGQCHAGKHDVQAIAVSLGPGSFTGVRIGSAAAKTLALALKIPLVGISTLEALAYPFRGLPDTLLVPVINARRQQVYTAFFHEDEGRLRRVSDDLALSAEPFAEALHQHAAGRRVLLIGMTEGLPAVFHTAHPAVAGAVRSLVTPHALAALAIERLQREDVDDPMTLAPVYLRPVAD